MKRVLSVVVSTFINVALIVFFSSASAVGQTVDPLREGIAQYQADNYEEAVELFVKARKQAPDSTTAAFWLGMAYKQQNNFQDALAPLTDAVTKTPPMKEALVELVDVLYRLERYDESLQWIAVAENENVYPAKTAFLKGMALARKERFGAAVSTFEKAKELDKAYTQSADFQIGLCYLHERKYDKASDRFRAAVTQDPLSDLGSFARRYQDMVEDRRWVERPLRLTFGVMGQYDTNMLTEPDPYPGLADAGEENSFGLLNTLRLDLAPTLPGAWLFNASYASSWNLHQKNATTHDIVANTLSIAPGYSFGRFALNLNVNYTDVMKRQPSYRSYSQSRSIGPMVRYMATGEQNHMLELYAGYAGKRFDNYRKDGDPALDPAENQTADGFDSYLSWMWILQNGAMVNLKYGFGEDHADGNNWSSSSHRFTLNTIIPLGKRLRLQLGGEVTMQDYKNASTIAIFNNEKRRDRVYTGTAGLTWDVNKYLSVLAQYTGTDNYSNFYIYDYSRSVYSLGLELRY
jgi:tetratricopeptide (TPR) repeat protein